MILNNESTYIFWYMKISITAAKVTVNIKIRIPYITKRKQDPEPATFLSITLFVLYVSHNICKPSGTNITPIKGQPDQRTEIQPQNIVRIYRRCIQNEIANITILIITADGRNELALYRIPEEKSKIMKVNKPNVTPYTSLIEFTKDPSQTAANIPNNILIP